MRFTPSATWSLLEGAGAKGLIWNVYARQIGHLSGSLTSGSWTDVTDYVLAFPGAEARLEFEVGEFTTNELGIDGFDLAFWRDNVLTTGSAYTEMKVTMNLTDGAKVSTDTPIVFSGFVARDTIEYNELSDRVRFTVTTPQDIGSRIAGEYLTTRYIYGDVIGPNENISGSLLQNISGIFIRTTNPAPNSITNGTFERFTGSADDDASDLIDGWTNVAAGGIVEVTKNGKNGNALRLYRTVVTTSGELSAYQTVPVSGATTYELTFSGWSTGNEKFANYAVYDNTSGSWIKSGSATTRFYNNWRSFSDTFTTNTGTTAVTVYLSHAAEVSTSLHFDDVSLLPRYQIAYTSSLAPSVGVHTLNYSYNNGEPSIAFDGGRSMALASGTTILGNGATEFEDTQRVHVYWGNPGGVASRIPKIDGITEEFVILNQGDALPYQWYRNASGRSLLAKLYGAMGITGSAITFGGLSMNSSDPAKITYLGNPPETGSFYGPKYALTASGSDLLIGLGSQVWKRSTATDGYTYLGDVGTGMIIGRIIHHEGGYAFIVYGPAVRDEDDFFHSVFPSDVRYRYSSRVRVYDYYEESLGNEVKLFDDGEESEVGDFNVNSMEVIANNNDVRLVATNVGSSILGHGRIISVASDGTRTEIDPGYDYYTLTSEFGYKRGEEFVFTIVTGSTYRAHIALRFDGVGGLVVSGTVLDGRVSPNLFKYENAIFAQNEGRIYYIDGQKIKSHTTSSMTTSSVGNLPTGSVFDLHYCPSKSQSFVAVQSTGSALRYWDDGYLLYQIASNTATLIGSGSAPSLKAMASVGSTVYGLDQDGRLFSYGTSSVPFIPTAKFGGMSIRDGLNDLLRSYVLVSTVYGKTAKVYQRTTGSGSFNTTGQTASVTIAEGSDITQKTLGKFDLVSVANDEESTTYDGTSFGTSVLSDRRRVDIASSLIHRTLIRDVASQAWGFFGRAHPTYTIPLEAYPAVEYEPLDAAALSLGSTKIGVSGVTGVIVATSVDQNGTVSFEVMT